MHHVSYLYLHEPPGFFTHKTGRLLHGIVRQDRCQHDGTAGARETTLLGVREGAMARHPKCLAPVDGQKSMACSKGEPLILNLRCPSISSEKNVETAGVSINHNGNKWFAMIFHDFSITFTPNKTPAENFCLDVGRSTTRGHDAQAAAAALHVFLIKLHILEEKDIFWGRRKTWKILIPFHSTFVGHVCFLPKSSSCFQKSNDWHVEAEPSSPTKITVSCLSKYRDSFPLSKFWFCQNFSFVFEKQKKTSQNATTLQTSSPSLLMENGLVQDRNRLVKWSNSIKNGKKGTLQRKKLTWKLENPWILLPFWKWVNMTQHVWSSESFFFSS